MATALSAVTGWVLFAALIGSIGAVVGRWALVPRAAPGPGVPRDWMERGAARLGSAATLLLPVAMLLFFYRQLQEFRDPFAPWRDDAVLLLTGTAWGRTWLWGLAGSALAAAGTMAAGTGRRWGWWVATPAVLALGAFPAFTGHAAGEEELRALALGADTMHVWAAGGWIGGLTLLLWLEAGWRRTSPESPASLLPQLVPAFSPLAMVCVAILAGTGLFASWMHLPSVAALYQTGYGRLLVFKLLLVAAVLALGALNWKRLTPHLGEAGGNDALSRAASTELLVAQLVLFVTAILVRTSPM